MQTFLFDTKTNTVITDAIELILGIWVHILYRHSNWERTE